MTQVPKPAQATTAGFDRAMRKSCTMLVEAFRDGYDGAARMVFHRLRHCLEHAHRPDADVLDAAFYLVPDVPENVLESHYQTLPMKWMAT